MYPRYFASCPIVQVSCSQMTSFFIIHNLVYSQYMYLTLLDFYIGSFHSSGRVILGLVDPCIPKPWASVKDAYPEPMKF
jgi:hypothetical protein